MSTSIIRDLPGLTNPITHAGRVVYNARRDFLETRSRKHGVKRGRTLVYANDKFGDPENHTIQQYELCMRNKRRKYQKWTPSDTDVQVFSSANGLQLTSEQQDEMPGEGRNVDNQADRVAKAEASLQFMGIASNRAIYDPRRNANEAHLAVQVGGLQTVYNTGDKTIYAGDIVLWAMPTLDAAGFPVRRIPGVPREKKLFATVPYEPETDLARALQKERAAGAAGLGAGGGGAGIEPNYKSMARALSSIQRRVMGKALSTAQPGDPKDILMGNCLV